MAASYKEGQSMTEVAANCVVSINFTLRDDKGDVLDASPADEPLVYLHGAEGIIPALEAGLVGKTVGEEFSITLEPADAFGDRQEDMVVSVPRSSFPAEQELQVGMQFQAEDPDSGDTRLLLIAEVGADTVTVDTNHPLAGITLSFQGNVHEVRTATEEEIAQGAPG
jgi:FKBP-type peptidyl-prolyl cis-trans isomerase SlyD